MNSQEIEEKLPDIVAFTELGDYLDLPVRTYSFGMMTRLTFAVATCFSPEILLMDEWIVAGDSSFMAKAQERIASFVSKANILVLASHSTEICMQWCNKAVWLEKGEVKALGAVDNVIHAYAGATLKASLAR